MDPPSQPKGLIEDKALMVFKIWTVMGADNGGEGGGTAGGEVENPYYERYGSWSTVVDEAARGRSVDVIQSTELGASALFKIDILQSGLYDVRVFWPETTSGTSSAKYEVYFVEKNLDETSETEEVITGPVLTTIIDQSSRSTEARDDQRFVSIGEVNVNVGGDVHLVTVVVRVSSGGAEYRQGEATLLMADAVNLEKVGF